MPIPNMSVDLVFGSPPYVDARNYLEDGKDLGISRDVHDWVEWMLLVTAECLRVSRGAVVWVAAGVTRDRNYQPACEGLMWEWFKRGGHAYRPCHWHRFGIPGSGGDQWFRADVESVMCFKRPGALPWADPKATGKPPKYEAGGPMSNRLADGRRVGRDWSSRVRNRKPNGVRDVPDRPCHERYAVDGLVANPGTLISTGAAGGGNIGSRLAHENEAPFPEELAERFLLSLCPPSGLVLDPFSGSGTTVSVATMHGRNGIGLDLRQSQCELGQRRITEGLRPVSKLDVKPVKAAPGQLSFFGDEA